MYYIFDSVSVRKIPSLIQIRRMQRCCHHDNKSRTLVCSQRMRLQTSPDVTTQVKGQSCTDCLVYYNGMVCDYIDQCRILSEISTQRHTCLSRKEIQKTSLLGRAPQNLDYCSFQHFQGCNISSGEISQ